MKLTYAYPKKCPKHSKVCPRNFIDETVTVPTNANVSREVRGTCTITGLNIHRRSYYVTVTNESSCETTRLRRLVLALAVC